MKETLYVFRLSLEEQRQQEESLDAELQQGHLRCQEVNKELSQVLEELGNARLDRHESRRQLQRKELLEKLRRLYPNTVVRDRLALQSEIISFPPGFSVLKAGNQSLQVKSVAV